MQAGSDLQANRTERGAVRASGRHVQESGDPTAGPPHVRYSNLCSFYLHPVVVAFFKFVPLLPLFYPLSFFPYILLMYSIFINTSGAGVYINFMPR
jgi:hypothetical protein